MPKNADEIWHAGDFGNLEVNRRTEKKQENYVAFSGILMMQKIRAEFPEIAILNAKK